jgi:hypothetical protein
MVINLREVYIFKINVTSSVNNEISQLDLLSTNGYKKILDGKFHILKNYTVTV